VRRFNVINDSPLFESYTSGNTYIHTYIHTYIPWIHKSVQVTTGCGISHNVQIHSYTDYRILHLNTINPRWGGEIFRSRPDRPWGPLSLLHNGYRVSVPGVKLPGRGVDHPPPSSADVKERVELYLYSPFGPSWPVLGRTLHYKLKHYTRVT
jgi:hypothetical protein